MKRMLSKHKLAKPASQDETLSSSTTPPLPQRQPSTMKRMLRKLSVSQKPKPPPHAQKSKLPVSKLNSRTLSSDEENQDVQSAAEAEQDFAKTTCKGHELKLERGISMCDRHVANCVFGEGCKHDCGQCKRKRESRRVNRERLERSMLYHSEKQRDAGWPGHERRSTDDEDGGGAGRNDGEEGSRGESGGRREFMVELKDR